MSDTVQFSADRQALLNKLLSGRIPNTPLPVEAIPNRTAKHTAPLSASQQQMWLLSQMIPETPVYNECVTVNLPGSLDTKALELSLNEIIRRHEVWRTSFPVQDGKPVQNVHSPFPIALNEIDLQALPAGEREHEAQRMAQAAVLVPFDLAHCPLLRCLLIHLGDNDHRLYLILHHIIFDGVSIYQVFMQELYALYTAFSAGKPSPLPELPIQYADYAQWQQNSMPDDVLNEQLSYWKQQLAEAPTSLELPVDHPRPLTPSYHGAKYTITLSARLSEAMKALCRQEGVTLFVMLLAAFNTLLYRYTGQEDLLVGTASSGRNHPDIQHLMGIFINTLVMRTNLADNPSFRELLRHVRDVSIEAQAHQDVAFEDVVKELRPQREVGINPFFQILLMLEPTAPILPGNWTLTPMDVNTYTSKFDLSLIIEDRSEGLTCCFEYSSDLFDEATIVRMAGHWQTLLASIVSDPSMPIADLPLLTEAEQHQLLIEWNDTARPYLQDVCVQHVIEAQVERTPNAPALLFEGQRLTYRQLNNRANQLAHYLRKLGVGPDVPVGICMDRSLDVVIALLAILKAGGAYVPLDPSYPSERLAFMVQDSHMLVLLSQQHLWSRLPASDVQILCLDSEGERSNFAQESVENPISEVTAENLAYIIYTSGSTGQPKGVMMPHSAVCNHLFGFQEQFQLTSEDRILQKTALSFDPSVNEFFAPLMAGAQMVLARPEGQRDSAYLVETIIQQRITLLQVVPTLLQMLLMEPDFKHCTSLRDVICGADVLPAIDAERFLAVLHANLYNLYGPTETCIDATLWRCQSSSKQTSIPIGRPEANVQTYILDKYLHPVPVGIPGELYIGGAGLARGYVNRPDLTAARFIPHPFKPQAGAQLYQTGDRVRYRPDGAIEFIGRLDQQVKLRGFRVELGEIETVLRQHPAVQEALVTLREDVPGDKRLVAYVVLGKQQDISVSDLQRYVMQRVPTYMVPSAITPLEKLPLMPNGKVNLKALPAPQQSGAAREDDIDFVTPTTIAQYQLVAIWEELLEARPIGIRDNFFYLGGHSMLAARLIQRMHQIFGKKLSLASLFANPTIEQLALALEQQEGPRPRVPLVAVQIKGSKRPFFYLHGDRSLGSFYCFTLARALGPDQPFYALGPYGFDEQALPKSIEEMAAAHIEIIRSVQPEGPYLIGGWCIGALMAHEVARQLYEAGQAIDLLILMDAGSVSTLAKVTVRACRTVGGLLHIRPEMQLNAFLLMRHLFNFRRFADYRKQFQYQLFPPARKLHENWGDITDWIAADYVRHPYPGNITFFWAKDEFSNLEAPWRSLAHAKGVETFIIPGDHITSRTEHIHDLAKQLADCISEVHNHDPQEPDP
jgi:amino acid adenylation domain-containing protein